MECRSTERDAVPDDFLSAKGKLDTKLQGLLASLDPQTRAALETLAKADPATQAAFLASVAPPERDALKRFLDLLSPK